MRGFTLVELMVSMVVFALILAMIFSMTDVISKSWKGTTEKMQSFEDARFAFDRIISNLSQATLNTYLDYDDPVAPKNYERHSELQFLSLPMSKLSSSLATGRTPVTHGLFFQAPTGQVSDKVSYGQMPNLLNAFGYFVDYGDDSPDRPSFVPLNLSPRYRYRLKEWRAPSDKFSLYKETSGIGPGKGTKYVGENSLSWINLKDSTSEGTLPHTVAENVVAFVISPKVTTDLKTSASNPLTSDFYYNSRTDGTTPLLVQQKNQLPPEVEVVMVAINETSAVKTLKNSASLPVLGSGLFTDPTKLEADLIKLTDELSSKNIRFIVLRSTVKLRGSRWTQN